MNTLVHPIRITSNVNGADTSSIVNLNASNHRNSIKPRKSTKKNKSVKLTPGFVIKFMNYVLRKRTLSHDIKMISNDSDSSSGSKVYLYTQDRYNYIIKVTGGRNIMHLNHVITELLIYNYLYALNTLNICDHIIYNYDSAIYQNPNPRAFLMINQTNNNDETVLSLYKFLKNIKDSIKKNMINIENITTYLHKIIPTLLFQLMYTLECLVRAKVKHNDLHLGNVLVFIDNTNIITNPNEFEDSKLKYDKYVVSSRIKADYFGPDIESYKTLYASNREKQNIDQDTITYYVPDYGFKIKVFDFDRSCVYDKDNKPVLFNKVFLNETSTKTQDFKYNYHKSYDFINTTPFEYVDLYKVFCNIFDRNKILFTKTTTINTDKTNANFIAFEKKLFNTTIKSFMREYTKYIIKTRNGAKELVCSYFIDTKQYKLMFEHKTVYEQLISIFNDTSDVTSIFYFGSPSLANNSQKHKIHKTYEIDNIKSLVHIPTTHNNANTIKNVNNSNTAIISLNNIIKASVVRRGTSSSSHSARRTIKRQLSKGSPTFSLTELIKIIHPLIVTDNNTNSTNNSHFNLDYNTSNGENDGT